MPSNKPKFANDTITVWGSPTRQFDSEYGIVTYYEWCVLESKRMGDDCHIVTANDGEIAITC